MIFILMQVKLIFAWKVLHLASVWQWEFKKLENEMEMEMEMGMEMAHWKRGLSRLL